MAESKELDLNRLKALPLEILLEMAVICPPLWRLHFFRSLLPKKLFNAYKLFYMLFQNGQSAFLRDSILIGADLHRLIESEDITTEPETWLVLVVPGKDIYPQDLKEHLRPHISHTHHRAQYIELSFLKINVRLFIASRKDRIAFPVYVTHPERLFQKQNNDYQTSLLRYGGDMRIKDSSRFLRILSEGTTPASISQYVTIYLDEHDPDNIIHVCHSTMAGLVWCVRNNDGTENIGLRYCNNFERKLREKQQVLLRRPRPDCQACLQKGFSPIPDVSW